MQKIERKVLGALLVLCDDKREFKGTHAELAKAMGYKHPGGALTLALQILEFKNYIVVENKTEKNKIIKVLV